MTRAVVVAFHNYCWTMDHKYFNVMSDYFMQNFAKYWRDEVDKLYIVDSTWGFKYEIPVLKDGKTDFFGKDEKVEVINVPENLRYYDAYKRILPKVEEDLVLFMDNDMVVYQKGVVDNTFNKLEKYDVVSIYDTIGKTHEELGGKSKVCPYWFGTHTKLLMTYLDVEWGPEMPMYETLGRLTDRMLRDKRTFFEIEEDKTVEGKNLGYYHIRAGSVPAYLLTTKHFGDEKIYWQYLKDSPASEVLRQCDWFDRMGGDTSEIRKDISEKKTNEVV